MTVASAEQRVVESYEYVDENGDVLYVVDRLEPKSFRQRRPDGNGGWVHNLDGVRRVPYRLPELIAQVERERLVFVVEGEKDVATMETLGCVATTAAGGGWQESWNRFFVGAKVVVVPDNDDAGRRKADAIVTTLAQDGVAAQLRTLRLPVEAKGDVTDWVDAGGDRVTLGKLLRSARDELAPKVPAGLSSRRLADVQAEEVRYLWRPWLPLGKLSLLVGHPDQGKSFVSLGISSILTNGAAFCDEDGGRDPCDVACIAYEDDPGDTIRPRAESMGIRLERFHVLAARDPETGLERSFSVADVPHLDAWLETFTDVRLLIVDPVMSLLGGREAYRDTEVRMILQPLVDLARRRNIAVLGIMHLKKGEEDRVLNRVGGSVAFVALARSVIFAGIHLDSGRRAITHEKANLSIHKGDPIEYRLDGRGFSWVGVAPELSTEVLLKPRTPDKDDAAPKRSRAAEWLRSFLAEGPRPASFAMQFARREQFSEKTVQRARREAGVIAEQYHDQWWWRLPADSPSWRQMAESWETRPEGGSGDHLISTGAPDGHPESASDLPRWTDGQEIDPLRGRDHLTDGQPLGHLSSKADLEPEDNNVLSFPTQREEF